MSALHNVDISAGVLLVLQCLGCSIGSLQVSVALGVSGALGQYHGCLGIWSMIFRLHDVPAGAVLVAPEAGRRLWTSLRPL